MCEYEDSDDVNDDQGEGLMSYSVMTTTDDRRSK